MSEDANGSLGWVGVNPNAMQLEPRGQKMFVGQIPRAWGERELLPTVLNLDNVSQLIIKFWQM